MKIWVALTDIHWVRALAALGPDEVNFWQPGGERRPVRLEAGAPYLFKLHAREGGHIVGGGYLAHWSVLPARLAWEAFGEKNGASTYEEMIQRIGRLLDRPIDPETHRIGCSLLVQPFFLAERDWISPPASWPASGIQQGRTYDAATPDGAALWERVQVALASQGMEGEHRIAEELPRYGEPILVRPRLGQGTFRIMVTDAYARRCAVTGERTLPVLQASHIKPFSQSGPHEVGNGLLLRADLHTLFDRGYITVTPDLAVRVSQKIREEFENGRDYYALAGRTVATPQPGFAPPRRELLEWHGDVVFRS